MPFGTSMVVEDWRGMNRAPPSKLREICWTKMERTVLLVFMSSTVSPSLTIVNRDGSRSLQSVYIGRVTTNTMPRPKRSEPVPPGQAVTTSVRMPGAVYNALLAASDQEDRTLNAQIVRVLREWAEKQSEP